MQVIIPILVKIFTFIFILVSMFGAGLGLTVQEIIAPLKNLSVVRRALLINFILVPLAAYAISVFFHLTPDMHAGLLLIALCAGAPFLPKMVTIAKGDVSHSVSLMVLLMLVTVIYLPVVLPLVVEGVRIQPWDVAKPQIFLMLPLVLGLLVKAWQAGFAALLKPWLEKASAVSIILVGILALWMDFPIFTHAFGTGIYFFLSLLMVFSLLIGFILGGSSLSDRTVMSLGAGARNLTAALLVAVINFPDRHVAAVVIIGSLVEFIFLLVFAKTSRWLAVD